MVGDVLPTGNGGGGGGVVVVVVVVDTVVGVVIVAVAAAGAGVPPKGGDAVGSGDEKPEGLESLPGVTEPEDACGVSLELEAIGCASGVGAGSVGPPGPAACCMGVGTSCAASRGIAARKNPATNTACTRTRRPKEKEVKSGGRIIRPSTRIRFENRVNPLILFSSRGWQEGIGRL